MFYIKNVKINNFRCYLTKEVEFSPNSNIIIGKNVMGGDVVKYEKEPPGKVVIEKNTIYEIDLDCVREKEKCKQEEKRDVNRQNTAKR